MSQNTSLPLHVHYRAEGSPDDWEEEEPRRPFLRTSTVPAIFDTSELKKGDTGLNLVVNLKAEGNDDADDQDASLTKDEKKLDTQSQSAQNPINKDLPILIVEDTVELAEVIQATLENMGLKADYATHGSRGLEMLKDLKPQLVLMDIGLPDITGWKMLDLIKEHCQEMRHPMPKIIVITAYGDPANRLIGKLQNIHSYLIKPFTPDQVENIVTLALRGESPENPEIGGAAPNS